MQIVLDVFGGDNAPNKILDGGLQAVEACGGFELVLVGNKDIIENYLSDKEYDASRIIIVDAKTVITNDDVPTEAIRKKKDSSLCVAFDYLNNHPEAKAFVSAGSTGAVLTGAVLLLRRIRGINRPGLCPILPTQINGKNVLLIDCGANVEPKPINMEQFAIMGSAYADTMLGVKNPRVGLLSNGTEDKKGNSLNKEVFPLLKKNENINFVGNIEAREMLSGNIDVIVSDGFSGNVALKACEGTALVMFNMIKNGIMSGGIRSKLGYLFLKPVFKQIKKEMDYNDNGGAVFLGLEKIVVKSHGSSKAKAIKNSILQAKEAVDKHVVEKIAGYMQNVL